MNPIAAAMRESLWLYPIVEIVHITGFAILVGAVAMFDLRLLGWGSALPVRALARQLLPWPMAALLLIVPSGLLMFSTAPQDFIANRTFLLKLVLICTAGVNAMVFHMGAYRHAAAWDSGVATPLAAKLHALASLLLWIGVISCGRLLAYT